MPDASIGPGSRLVRRWFDVPAPVDDVAHTIDASPAPGELWLITGASGAGKSTLLRSLRARSGWTTLDLHACEPPDIPLADMCDESTLELWLERLARLGLGEVWSWLRTPAQLSDGQRWRLRLAWAMRDLARDADPRILVCDEFAALLDRVSAIIVARSLRVEVDRSHRRVGAVVATSHDDLIDALDPDAIVECDFGAIELIRRDRSGVRTPASAAGSPPRSPPGSPPAG
jgi:ABC-type ATPase with predicted acetyltransferase domain